MVSGGQHNTFMEIYKEMLRSKDLAFTYEQYFKPKEE